MNKTNLSIYYVYLFVLFFTTNNAIGHENTVKACFTEWLPYSYMKDGQPTGLSIEIYEEVIKKSGMEITFDIKPWKRCVAEFSIGKYDAVVDGDDFIPNSLNAKQPPIPWVITFWVHEDSPVQKFSGYSQFDNQVVGYVGGYTYPEKFSNYAGFKNKYSVRKDLVGLNMLQGGRYKAFIGDVVNNTWLVKENNMKVRALGPAIQLKYLTLSFSDRLPEKHKRFEATLNQMYEDGSIDVFYKKYLGVTYADFINKYGGD